MMQYKDISMVCLGFLIGFSFVFAAARLLWVQVITDTGIIENHRFFFIPMIHKVIEWDTITDYYVKANYPNTVFHILYKKEEVRVQKIEVHVPSNLQNYFSQTLDAKLDGEDDIPMYRYRKSRGMID
jgi:hypothetical protein